MSPNFRSSWMSPHNLSPLKQNGSHFADDIFKYIFHEWKVLYLINILLKFVPVGQTNTIPALVQNRLAPNRRQAIIWTNAVPVHWCVYAVLGGDELTMITICTFNTGLQMNYALKLKCAKLPGIPTQHLEELSRFSVKASDRSKKSQNTINATRQRWSWPSFKSFDMVAYCIHSNITLHL